MSMAKDKGMWWVLCPKCVFYTDVNRIGYNKNQSTFSVIWYSHYCDWTTPNTLIYVINLK